MTPSELTANASTMVQELRDKIGDTLILAEFTNDNLFHHLTEFGDVVSVLDSLSGCAVEAELKAFGMTNIKLFTNSDDLLAQYSDDELLEAITNNNERDVLAMATQLIAAECVLDDAKHDWILSNIKALVAQL